MPTSHNRLGEFRAVTRVGISLFSGAGGMDVGFTQAGVRVVWANDLDRDACATYEANHGAHIHQGNIMGLTPSLARYEGADVLFGGPPCQGFSVAGKMDLSDERSLLVFAFMDAVKTVRPIAFVLENVRALAELEKFYQVRQQLIRTASKQGYSCALIVLNASEYGVPQSRDRMFLVGFRDFDRSEEFLSNLLAMRRRAPALRDVIIPLGKAGSGGNSRVCRAKVTMATRPVLRKSPYAGMLFNGQGRPLNPSGFASTLPASMGGNRTPIIDEQQLFEGAESWVEKYHAHLLAGGSPSTSDPPPWLRRLTVDEALLLQTFPVGYEFLGRQSSVFAQIGNAVPCRLAYAVAVAILNTLDGFNPKKTNQQQMYLAV